MGRGFPAPVATGAGRPQQELGAPILVPVLDAGHQLGPSLLPTPTPGTLLGAAPSAAQSDPAKNSVLWDLLLPRFHVSHLPGLTTWFRGYWL